MDALHIPDTATETYLERLAENITRQIERAQNKKVRAHLDLMLENVYARLQEKRRESKKFPQREEQDDLEVLELTDEFQEEGADDASGDEASGDKASAVDDASEQPSPAIVDGSGQSDVLLLTELIEEEEQLAASETEFSTQEHQVVKDRLRLVLQKVEERKHRTPEEDDDVVLADVMREMTEEEPIDSSDFSTDQESKVKERLRFILEAVQLKKQQLLEGDEFGDGMQTLTRGYRSRVESEDAIAGETVDGVGQDGASSVLRVQAFKPLSKDQQFVEICDKISKGHSIDLFKSMPLSDREKDILNAMATQLSSYKGLKKQQVFEMQHLTARSIHELDLIFKTYHIQGYLKAELSNVYNRLLNIRGRFSMLLS